ncbi:MAG: hypothetical protein WA962_10545 [Ornithinimicrobium sp.]
MRERQAKTVVMAVAGVQMARSSGDRDAPSAIMPMLGGLAFPV